MSSSKQSGGHIKIARRMFDDTSEHWVDGTRFDSRSAWIDLIQMAAWAPYLYRGVDALERGEFVASVRYLAERWQWPKSTVSDSLRIRTLAGQLAVQRVGHHGTIYLLVNYDLYQSEGKIAGHRAGHSAVENPDAARTNKSSKAVQENTSSAADAAGRVVDALAEGFTDCWAIYPSRVGGNPRHEALKAYRARRRDGVGADELLAGVQRYAAWCEANGKTDSPYVMRASTFFGPALRFTEDWGAGRDAVDPDAHARHWLMLVKRHDLLTYTGNRADYGAKVERAKADPEAPAQFDAELRAVRPWDGLGGMEERFVLKAIQERLAGSERRAAA